ncbi:MAG: TSUP family transporter [Clostridia bacterium]|nr:TSUP family transporter [Clostridia bacterium]
MKPAKTSRRSCFNLIFLCATSFFAGFFNGLFGTGGGIFLWLYLSRRKPLPTVFATSAAGVFLLCLFSLLFNADFSAEENIIFPLFAFLCVLGGGIGGLLLDKIKDKLLQIVFGILLMISGGYSLFVSLR